MGAIAGRRRSGGLPGPDGINLSQFSTDVGDMPYWELSTLEIEPSSKSELPNGTIQTPSKPTTKTPIKTNAGLSKTDGRNNTSDAIPLSFAPITRGGAPSAQTSPEENAKRADKIITTEPVIPEQKDNTKEPKDKPIKESKETPPEEPNTPTDITPGTPPNTLPDKPPEEIVPPTIVYIPWPEPERVDPPITDVDAFTEVVAKTRSTEFTADAINSGRAIGINQSNFSFDKKEALGDMTRDSLVFRHSKTTADSIHTNASVEQNLKSYAVNQSTGKAANEQGTFLAATVEVNEIKINSGNKALVNVTSEASAFNQSTWTGAKDIDLIQFETIMVNRLYGLGESKTAEIKLDLEATGLKDSQGSSINLKHNIFENREKLEYGLNKEEKSKILEYSIDGGITWIKPTLDEEKNAPAEYTISNVGDLIVNENGTWELKPYINWDQEPISFLYRSNKEELDVENELIGESGQDQINVFTAMTGAPNTGISLYDNEIIETTLTKLVIPINDKNHAQYERLMDDKIDLGVVQLIDTGESQSDYIAIAPELVATIQKDEIVTFTDEIGGVYSGIPYFVKNIDRGESTIQISRNILSKETVDFTTSIGNAARLTPIDEVSLYEPGIEKSEYGIDIDFMKTNCLEEAGVDIEIDARSICMKNSIITTGDGDDQINMSAFMMEYLNADIATLGDRVNNSSISLGVYSLFDSKILTGSGNDVLFLRGDIDGLEGSTIDVGTGINELNINGEIAENTMFRIGQGNGALVVSGTQVNEDLEKNGNTTGYRSTDNSTLFIEKVEFYGTDLQPGEYFENRLNNDDNDWEIISPGQHKIFNGYAGKDTIVSSGKGNSDRIKLVGKDMSNENNNAELSIEQETVEAGAGYIFDTPFLNFESVDVKFSDDIVMMQNLGGLSGKLMMGEGIDTLDYSTWGKEATVNFGSNQASGIGTGYTESSLSDAMEGKGVTSVGASNSFSGVDIVIATPYDDLLSLEWTPWLDDSNTDFEFRAGDGADTYQFYGLDAEEGKQWMNTSSVPTLRNVNLDEGDRFEGFLDNEGKTIINATLIPIEPLEMLRAGITEGIDPYLGISNDNAAHQLHALGLDGDNGSRLLANLPGFMPKNSATEEA